VLSLRRNKSDAVLDDDREPGDPFDSHPRSFALSPRCTVSLMARRTRHRSSTPEP
jgi:hypothetical protein